MPDKPLPVIIAAWLVMLAILATFLTAMALIVVTMWRTIL